MGRKRKGPWVRYLVIWLALAASVGTVWMLGGHGEAADPRAAPLLEISAPAAAPSPPPMPETATMRGLWAPYMALTRGEDFQSNFRSIADSAKAKGFTSLFVHVRAFCDALYPSQLYPWSHLLTGEQGKDPGFDPLAFMVDYTHSLGLEFHAWINPLRVSSGETPGTFAKDNPYLALRDQYPYYFMEYDGGVYLNPAYPYIRTLIAKGAAEIVEGYDVDGIHFDDYFYPSQEPELDQASYQLYLETVSQPMSLAEWRSANIDAMVAEVYQRVKAADSQAVFGISPQGNLKNDREMGADVAAWCATPGYIDYICPQLYYSYENETLPYPQALEEWTSLYRHKDLDLYIGLALYKAGSETEAGWDGGDVIQRQILDAHAALCNGIILYSCEQLENPQTEGEMRNAVAAMASLP